MNARNLLALALAATGNANAAALLLRIDFWDEKNGGVWLDGRHWIWGNYRYWMQETGLTYKQVKCAFALLRRLGLVETMNLPDHFLVKMHVRVIRQDWKNGPSCKAQMGPAARPKRAKPEDPNGTCGKAQMGPNIYREVSHGGLTWRSPKEVPQGGLTAAGSLDEKIDYIPGGEDKQEKAVKTKNPFVKGGHSMSSVESTLASAKAQAQAANEGQPTKLSDMASIWTDKLHEATGEFVHLLKKDEANLKLLLEAWGPDAGSVLAHILDHWSDFTLHAKKNFGAFGLPPKPVLYFLLQHRLSASMLYSASKQIGPQVAQHEAVKPAKAMKVTEHMQLTSQPAKGMSAEDEAAIAAMLGLKPKGKQQ